MLRRGGLLHRESLKTTDLSFARRKLDGFKNRLDRTDPTKGRMTFVRWLEDAYLPTLRGAEKTIRNKQCIIERVKSTWVTARTQPMRELKPSEVERWLNKEFSRGTGAYWNSAFMVIRAALALAVKDRVLFENPAAGLSYHKRKRPIRLTPTWEQFQSIVADIRSQKFNGHEAEQSADFIEFCGLAGLGQAEVSAIKRCDVDLESGRMIVYRRKTDTGFAIPIYPQLRPLLEKRCAGRKPNDYLFQIQQARVALANACARLEFPAFSHRSLRRMFIVRAIEKGIDVKTISEWQGHRDGGTLILRTYSHVRPVHSQRMAALMSDEQPPNVVPMRASDNARAN
jgi:integrase